MNKLIKTIQSQIIINILLILWVGFYIASFVPYPSHLNLSCYYPSLVILVVYSVGTGIRSYNLSRKIEDIKMALCDISCRQEKLRVELAKFKLAVELETSREYTDETKE